MSTLVRFDPFGLMRDFDRLIEGTERTSGWVPRIDVFERKGDLVVRAEAPGIDPETLQVTIEAGTLTIEGSRSFEQEDSEGDFHRKEIFEGKFHRTILLPEGADTEQVTATTKDGILEVVVPRRPEVLPRKVEVQVDR